jgi:membrane-bound lytic murein transglycosylase D
MYMRLLSPWTLPLALVALLSGTTGCSAPKSSAALPPQATAPTLKTTATPAAKPESKPQAAPSTSIQPTSSPAPASDAIDQLIVQVEKEYQAGLDNQRAGQTDAARKNFDRALHLLVTSRFDVHSDPRLEQECERILDATHPVESAAAQETEPGTEQKSEPAPIDEANEVTFPVDANVKAKAEAEIRSTRSDLPLMMTDQVAGYISYFSTRGHATIANALARSGRYDDMIRRILKEEGVPQDLIYLAQAESGFHPLALSRAGARGMWQFMGSRAKGYGLERNFWLDERQDPDKSTRAAARHLKDLYNQFGDWYLAMAAYNSGPGTVQSAVRRTGYADFWELYRRNVLPKETRNYVPIIVAVTIMAKNPEQYGLDTIVRERPLDYDTVKIDYSVDLRLVADCVDASVTDLQDLNPSLLRYVTPKDKEFQLRLPLGTKDKFQTAIAAIPADMRPWWRYHKVQADDTLASIARAYRTTPKAIFTANELESEELVADRKLIIPIAPGKHPAGEDGMTYARRTTRYKIRKGDTVLSVSENLGIPPRMIRGWNRLKGDSLKGRRVLYVHLPVSPAAAREQQLATVKKSKTKSSSAKTVAAGSGVHHKVKQGETLYSIANSYNTTVTALKRANSNIATLRPGMVLIIRP